MGKGDKRRPQQISNEEMDRREAKWRGAVFMIDGKEYPIKSISIDLAVEEQ